VKSPSNQLHDNGFFAVNNPLSEYQRQTLLKSIKKKINRYIHESEQSENSYLKAVNRWPLKQLVSISEYVEIINTAKHGAEIATGEKLESFEADIIYKSPNVKQPTPCHQDIAYAWEKPYSFSTWIPLNQLDQLCSSLLFLASSHIGEISPAIDFWSPNFVDTIRKSENWKNNVVKTNTNPNTSFIFSSKIWHATTEHLSNNERFVIVIRWGNKNSLLTKVPKPCMQHFGMWTCNKITNKILSDAWYSIFYQRITSTTELVDAWLCHIPKLKNIKNRQDALQTLDSLKTLHHAHQSYQGSDGQGIVYSNLWKQLLLPLKTGLLNGKLETETKILGESFD